MSRPAPAATWRSPCDIVIAAKSASFIQVFSRIGLIPDAGGTYTLPRLVGTARAMAAAMLAEKVSAEQAANWGMIWKCVDDDKFASEAQRAGADNWPDRRPRRWDSPSARSTRRPTNTFEQQLDLERDLQREAAKQRRTSSEGVAAFKEKRPAKFTGA